VLALAAVAFAARTNQYNVTGSVSPTKSGTKKKPAAVSVKFDYTISEASSQRPSPVKRYKILIDGVNVNSKLWPACTAARINAAQSDQSCPKGSLVGTGSITAVAGNEANPNDKSINCYLSLKVYNAGNNRAALFLTGSPSQSLPPEKRCATSFSAAIAANYVRSARGTTLQFDVPEVPFRSQVNGTIEVSTIKTQSTIKRLTRTVKGRKVGYYETVGGCRAGKRAITVTFLNEDNQTAQGQATSKCSK